MFRRHFSDLFRRRSSDDLAAFSVKDWKTTTTSCKNVAGTSHGGDSTQFFWPYWPLWHVGEGDTRTHVSTFCFRAARACRSYVDGVLSRSARTSRTTFKWSHCVSISHFTRRALGRNRFWAGTWPWYLSSSTTR